MIEFREICDTDPTLGHSPMVRAIGRIFDFIAEHGGIELTPSKAFKRKFVHWAAAEFAWPGYTEADLFALNKVLNEIDFPPLMDIHEMLVALNIGRHHSGKFMLTRVGKTLAGHPGRVFGTVTPRYLFEADHLRFTRTPERVPGNWDIFLNVLNVAAEDGMSGPEVGQLLLGRGVSDAALRRFSSVFYVQVLRPLCWTGLLEEARPDRPSFEDRVFTKTPLWRAALRLSTDGEVSRAVRH